MTLIKNICEYLDTVAPFDTQADFDNSGLLVGDIDTQINKVMLSLDITDKVAKEAKDNGCELIISHHPVIFSPLKSICPDDIVYKLISSTLSAVCVHTNLDKAESVGVNQCLADKLGLTDTVLYPQHYLCVGKLSHPMSDQEFAQHVKSSLLCKGVRYTKSGFINTVAVSSGAGSDAITLNKLYGFDALVTGELKHHHFLYAVEESLCAVEAGHFNTETVVLAPLKERLSRQFPQVEFIISQSETDPVEFV